MSDKYKRQIRASKTWKEFRERMRSLHHNRDDLTLKPLRKGWQLHHQDMSDENYSDFNPNNFNTLNRRSHECIHFLFTYYKTDRDILKRLRKILDRMVELNSTK